MVTADVLALTFSMGGAVFALITIVNQLLNLTKAKKHLRTLSQRLAIRVATYVIAADLASNSEFASLHHSILDDGDIDDEELEQLEGFIEGKRNTSRRGNG